MKSLTLFLFLLSGVSALTSCSEKKVVEKKLASKTHEDAITSGTNLQEQINRGFILSSSSRQDRDGIITNLKTMIGLIQKLGENPTDRSAFELMIQANNELLSFQMGVRDEIAFRNFLEQVSEIIDLSANRMNLAVTNVNWKLFSYKFSRGLHPFATFSDSTEWDTGISLDRYYARVAGGNPVKSWLLSPKIDLSRATKPSFKMRHTITINRSADGGWFDRAEILRNGFKVLVSTDYDGSDPNKATWESLKINIPQSTTDFFTDDTDKISLAKYAGQRVTLGFVFELKRDYGFHYSSWQIENFQIWGAGKVQGTKSNGAYKAHSVFGDNIVFNHKFNGRFKGFSQQTVEGQPAEFLRKFRAGKHYVTISGFAGPDAPRKDGTQVLLSDAIDLSFVTEARVSVLQTINHYYNKEKELIKIVAIEEGLDFSKANYKELNFNKVPPGQDWNPVQSEWLALPEELQRKKVRIGFIYKSVEDEAPSWDLFRLLIQDGQGE